MFHEIRFPTSIAFHSTGGPERKTEIVTLGSGYEERNGVWANSRRRYDVGYGIKTLDDIAAVIAFFEARSGRLYGFRFKGLCRFQIGRPGSFRHDVRPDTRQRRRRHSKLRAGQDLHVRTRQLDARDCQTGGGHGARRNRGHGNHRLHRRTPPPASSPSQPCPQLGPPLLPGSSSMSRCVSTPTNLPINLAGFRVGEIASIPLVEIRV